MRLKTLAAVALAIALGTTPSYSANYERVIRQAYQEILARDPDSGGLAHWNERMNAGLTEAAMREALLRSAEYQARFPGPSPAPAPTPTPVPPPPPPPPTAGVTRAAFFYPWFPATWSVNGAHVKYKPAPGYYSSDDASVVDGHVRSLDYGKINVAIASWWGQGQQSEQTRIPLLLDRTRAAGSPLRWALYYEKEGFGDPSLEEVRADLSYISREYAPRPEYARRDGKPVLFVYNADDSSCAVADKWQTATAGHWYLVLKIFPGWESCAAKADSWHQYGPSTSSASVSGSYAISPGYWQADEAAARLPRDVTAWAAAVRAMVASGKTWQLIISFNEWGEGTAVESAQEWSSASGHGAYLDVLHNDGQATPPPPPPPPVGTMEPLRVQGNRFATSAGPIHLQGHIICCDSDGTPEDEALVRGWPWVDAATLDLMAEYKLNYAHVRLGPFSLGEPNPVQAYRLVTRNEDGGVFDLNQWDAGHWQRLRALIAHAATRGIYVELDLIDMWGLDHEVTPWSPQRNTNGVNAGSMDATRNRLQPTHDAWIRKVIRETAEFPNVLYSDGNESWKQSGTAWSEGVIAVAKDELSRLGLPRLVGSNNEDGPSNMDYLSLHQKTAAGARSVPVLVNEYQTLPVETVLAEAKRGRDMGTSFMYWAGGHNAADRLRTFQGLKTIIEGGEPPPVAGSCPVLARWGSSVHVLHIGSQLLSIPKPVQNGAVKAYGRLTQGATLVADSTPRFGGGNGFPCNEEKGFDTCGGRNCEDPRGPVWTLLEAPGDVKHRVGGNPYQYQVGPMSPGDYRLRVCPRSDVQDALGQSVPTSNQPCSEITWSI
jgi:hypothetical protein